ncbi:MAG TPA: VOC family protein [Chloroflexota bacterium]|jgi:catechol 2,3-dioxygenase-like lactoylglutathione lyase family enzyme
MFKISGIVHWSIGVDNLDQAERFYRDVLGLECRGRLSGGNNMSAFRVGDQSLLLCQRSDPLERRPEQEYPLHFAFHLEPEEWDKAAHTLRDMGVTPYGPVFYREKGFFPGRELFVLDPSGNRIELSDGSWQPGMPKPTFEEIVGASPSLA